MPEVIFTHRAGSAPIGLRVHIDSNEEFELIGGEVGAIFRLESVSRDDHGNVGIEFVPSRGCVEIMKAME